MSIQIITESASDITQEQAKELGIHVIPMRTTFGNTEYLDGIELSHEEFFEKLIETDEFPKTTQVTPYEYQNCMEQFPDDDILIIAVSSKLSGCYSSAVIAAGDKPRVRVVDSLNVTVGQRLLILRAIKLREEGKTIDEIVEAIEEEKKEIRLVALVDTLEYLKRGGRVSPTVAFVGNMLSIKPVIGIVDGEVAILGKARGSKNANNHLTELVTKEGGIDFDRPFSLAYSGLSDALLKKYMKDHASLYEDHCSMEDLPVASIGSTIGTHAGPGAIAVTFFKPRR